MYKTAKGINVATGEWIVVEFDDVIRAITPTEPDADSWLIAPGFIDLQVNGFGGIDFNCPVTPTNEISRALDVILSTGVTRCLPTVITAPPDDMIACLRNLAKAKRELPKGNAIAGFHVEGPHIAPEDGPRGVHPRDSVRAPDIDELRRWQDVTDHAIRLVTLSPHWAGAVPYIEAAVRDGVTVSIGHTGASAEQIRAAVDAGAMLSTHLGNAAPRILPKISNCIWDQLAEDRLSASFIADGIHLDMPFLLAAVRAKTPARSILVTDASAPAGAPAGRYRLGAQFADLTPDGRVVLAGTDRLAGSALTMDDAIANVMRMSGVSLREAVEMATIHPARLIGLAERSRGLAVGERADFVLFRAGERIAIDAVYLDGERAA